MQINAFPIEWGHMAMFASAVGDEHEMYRLDGPGLTDPTSVTAPPTFTAAQAHFDEDWELRPRPGVPWIGSGRGATGVTAQEDSARNLLHAEQAYEYHAPVHPGDVLTVTTIPGATWTKTGRRGGQLTFSQGVQEFRNQRGELVITSTSTSVITESSNE
ncbi:MaoC family dehydratase N-terminal domain-containing protein [Nocardioides sp. AE5]|uniref:FAS1-like dehydratase domain-containing protein n=1 Tax=Nocardioides sp. AE5 TaxID=2962573 RepID=UPI002881CF27|nr:MaoC family dehydratase N-terminal domain-containing protein [Nocardioides sp. AE5]MDT0203172.1 MaoC family dehydratase N-terminal domain-containing protein [Nocardioides sp. AE5]